MPDTIVVQSRCAVTREWLLTPMDQRDPSLDLVDCVVIALGTDRLAQPDDELPEKGDTNRRGWWGDLDADAIRDGWPIGTRLWLLARSSITGAAARRGSTVARVETYIREALQPFKDKGVASRVSVLAERVGVERIDATATLYRGPLPSIALRFSDLWQSIRA
jgi:phage gp46-like protein